jgi:Fe-S cluster assembly protein SufD
MSRETRSRHPFLHSFAETERALALSDPAWLRSLRQASAERFESLDFPSHRLEAWRTTNVAKLAAVGFGPAPRRDQETDAGCLPALARLELGGPRLVLLDGRHAPGLSSTTDLPAGVWAGSLSSALREIPERVEHHLKHHSPQEAPAFVALNGALVEDGAVVIIPEGVVLEQPIHLVFASTGGETPTATSPRTLIVSGKGSEASVVETYTGVGEQAYLVNAVTDAVVGDNATLNHYRIQLEGPSAYHISNSRSRQGRDSRYLHHNINLGGRLVRNDLMAVLEGEGGWCQLNGLNLTSGEQHVDNHTTLDHTKPHCDSRELYKGILSGRSRGVFNGRIIVRRDAQKTDAKQSNPNLLLSAGALANTRPQLEIYADDVKCTHGATIGRLDSEAVFYLRSRGMSEAEARGLLLEAFAGEVLQEIGPEPLQAYLRSVVAECLESATRSTERRK